MTSPSQPSPVYHRGIFIFAVFSVGWSLVVLFAGGFTTSIGAGMAFLDWPLSDGSLNPPGWTRDQDQLAEHGHRLTAGLILIFSIILAWWIQLRDPRRGVRVLGWVLVAVVALQAVLGGLRVLFDQLNIGTDSNVVAQSFAVGHALGAQAAFCLLLTVAVVQSRGWIEESFPVRVPVRFVRWLGFGFGLLLVTVLFGAVMRHIGAGLAIPFFPWSGPEREILPVSWSFPVTIHFLHRLGAALAVLLLAVLVGWVFLRLRVRRIEGWAGTVGFLLVLQLYLAYLVIDSGRNEHAATAHMLVGALVVGSVWVLFLWSWRYAGEAGRENR